LEKLLTNKGACVNIVLASKGYIVEFVKAYEISIVEAGKDKGGSRF